MCRMRARMREVDEWFSLNDAGANMVCGEKSDFFESLPTGFLNDKDGLWQFPHFPSPHGVTV